MKTVTFQTLLELGRAERFDEIASLPGAGTHDGVAAVMSRWRSAIKFIDSLSTEDLRHFARAVAVFEDTAGGLGSVTLLQHVMPRINEPNGATLAWIKRNTSSYRYYQDR